MAKKKPPTKAERYHMGKVAALGCIACQKIGYFDTPAEIHHIRATVGAGQRASHYDVIPLCPEHHRHGNNAVHRSIVAFTEQFGSEIDLLNEVKGMI